MPMSGGIRFTGSILMDCGSIMEIGVDLIILVVTIGLGINLRHKNNKTYYHHKTT